jgi:cbb3-type cytochrome oxidase maturation protein
MDSLYLLVPVSIVLVFIIGAIFWWALNNRQFEALDEEGGMILKDVDFHEDPVIKSDGRIE